MTTETIRGAGSHEFGELTRAISRAVAAITAGARASHDWRRMNALTDAALAREGLTRENIARAVLERHFG